MPSTAANESWNDSVATVCGSISAITAPANAIAGATLRCRPRAIASRYTLAITTARVTDGDSPAIKAYTTSASRGASRYICRLRPNRRAANASAMPPTIATCSPEIARRWLIPASRKSFRRSVLRPVRSPVVTAVANPDAAPGTVFKIEAEAAPRASAIARRNALPDVESISLTVPDVTTPTASSDIPGGNPSLVERDWNRPVT